MMKPTSVTVFLPHVDQVATDFVNYIDAQREQDTNEVHDIENHIKKWSFEC